MADEQTNSTIIGSIPRPNRRHLNFWALLAVVLIIIVLIIIEAARGSIGGQAAHLLYLDPNSGKATLTNASDKVSSTTNYTIGSLYNYEAVTPNGGVLLSSGVGGAGASYLFIGDKGQAKDLASTAVTTLNSAVELDTLHQVYFTNQDTLVLVSCPAGATCQLKTLNVFTGTTQDIIDTGVKAGNGLVPVYLLGLSQNRSIAYLRVIGSSKLGKSSGAIYQVDLKSHKVVQTTGFSSSVDYSATMSPDAQKVVYRTGGYGSEIDIHILNLLSNKDGKAKWIGGEIGSQPGNFIWSPDSTKVLISDLNIPPPPGQAAAFKSLTIGYLDTLKMSVTSLKTVSDPAHNTLNGKGWMGNDTMVYQTASSAREYDFSDSTYTTYKETVSDKKTSTIQSYGALSHSIYW